MLSSIVGFYEFQERRGNALAQDLVEKTRCGYGGYKPFLAGIAPRRPRGRAVRLAQERRLPRTLSLEQVAAVIDCQRRLRDGFLFALLASTGMRVGQALGLRHEDIVSWERARAGESGHLDSDFVLLAKRGVEANFATVAATAGVSRQFLYSHAELRAEIERLRDQRRSELSGRRA